MVCINADFSGADTSDFSQLPTCGQIYTIRSVELDDCGDDGITLVEIVNPNYPYITGSSEPLFHPERFRSIDYSFGEQVCNELEVITEPQLI